MAVDVNEAETRHVRRQHSGRMSEREREREEHLAKMVNAVAGTIRKDGTVQLSPNWYLWAVERMLISTSSWTAKVHNIRRDPRVTICVDDPVSGRYVAISGTATLIDDDRVRDLTMALIAKYVSEAEVLPHWERINRNADRVILEVEPAKILWRRGF